MKLLRPPIRELVVGAFLVALFFLVFQVQFTLDYTSLAGSVSRLLVNIRIAPETSESSALWLSAGETPGSIGGIHHSLPYSRPKHSVKWGSYDIPRTSIVSHAAGAPIAAMKPACH